MGLQFFIKLAGAGKHDAALLQPVGSYQFLYDPTRNEHLLEGKALPQERFNEAIEDILRRFPSGSQYRAVPVVEGSVDAPAGWEQERAALLQEIAEQKETIVALMRPPARRAARAQPSPATEA